MHTTMWAGRRAIAPKLLLLLVPLALMLLLGACKEEEDQPKELAAPSVDMGIPSSLTGSASSSSSYLPLAEGDPNCSFAGQGESDPLRNGYTMTRWLVGNTAGWLCFTDFLTSTVATLVSAGAVPTDGSYVSIGDGSGGDPVGLSVLITDTQTELRLYFLSTTTPGMFLAWTGSGTDVSGRLVIHSALVNADPSTNLAVDREAPTHARLDFAFNSTQQVARMYMAFDPYNEYAPPSWDNPWATGFRVDAIKTLADSSFDIQGIITVKRQFDESYPGTELPSLRMLAVSDSAGTGASVAQISDFGLGLRVDADDLIGYFTFDKDDRYYFTSAGAAEWINKGVTSTTYLSGSEDYSGTPSDNNITWSDTVVDLALSLTSGTTASCKSGTDADCLTLFKTIFENGAFGTEENSTSDEPTDSRKTDLDAATFLTQATPPGTAAGDWTGVFDNAYTP